MGIGTTTPNPPELMNLCMKLAGRQSVLGPETVPKKFFTNQMYGQEGSSASHNLFLKI